MTTIQIQIVRRGKHAGKPEPSPTPGPPHVKASACRRAANWQLAIDALEKSINLTAGEGIEGTASGESWNAFFLAMAHEQLGHHDESHRWYDQAVAWMEKNEAYSGELSRFRDEAAELLGITEWQPSTVPNSKP